MYTHILVTEDYGPASQPWFGQTGRIKRRKTPTWGQINIHFFATPLGLELCNIHLRTYSVLIISRGELREINTSCYTFSVPIGHRIDCMMPTKKERNLGRRIKTWHASNTLLILHGPCKKKKVQLFLICADWQFISEVKQCSFREH